MSQDTNMQPVWVPMQYVMSQPHAGTVGYYPMPYPMPQMVPVAMNHSAEASQNYVAVAQPHSAVPDLYVVSSSLL